MPGTLFVLSSSLVGSGQLLITSCYLLLASSFLPATPVGSPAPRGFRAWRRVYAFFAHTEAFRQATTPSMTLPMPS